MTRALASIPNPEDLLNIVSKVNRHGNLIDEMVDSLVQQYCGSLDDYMRQIDNILVRQEDPPTNAQLDDFVLNLPVLLYFTGEAQEALGIKEDVANSIRLDVYNRIREKAQGTVADKDTAAELATQAETIVTIIYRRAYKKVKLRMEAGYETLNSVKKVVSRRMGEAELSNSDRGRTI